MAMSKKEQAHVAESQLDMFGQVSAAVASPERIDLVTRIRLLMGSVEFESFAWWCKNGSRSMCEAVLWKRGIVSTNDARQAVCEIGGVA